MTDKEQKEAIQKQAIIARIVDFIDDAVSRVEGYSGDIFDHENNVEYDVKTNEIFISTRHKNPNLRLIGLKINFYRG